MSRKRQSYAPRSSTPQKIVDAARELFNEKGYAATSLQEIAAAVGISQGNLTYHFPTKRELAVRIESEAREVARLRRATQQPGDIADDYVEHLLFGMNITWNNRFLLRDRIHFSGEPEEPSAEHAADFDELHELLKRIDAEGLFKSDAVSDLEILTRSIWIISRYWMDYLRESEGKVQISWQDQERGIRHHYAVLLPCLTRTARKHFTDALRRATRRQEK